MPPKGTAGLARSAVSGASRFPSPPARTIASTWGRAMARTVDDRRPPTEAGSARFEGPRPDSSRYDPVPRGLVREPAAAAGTYALVRRVRGSGRPPHRRLPRPGERRAAADLGPGPHRAPAHHDGPPIRRAEDGPAALRPRRRAHRPRRLELGPGPSPRVVGQSPHEARDAGPDRAGAPKAYRARLVTGEERDRVWPLLLVEVWPAYETYAQRAGRDIRVFVLEPSTAEGAPHVTEGAER